jgi:hypothetical protein
MSFGNYPFGNSGFDNSGFENSGFSNLGFDNSTIQDLTIRDSTIRDSTIRDSTIRDSTNRDSTSEHCTERGCAEAERHTMICKNESWCTKPAWGKKICRTCNLVYKTSLRRQKSGSFFNLIFRARRFAKSIFS